MCLTITNSSRKKTCRLIKHHRKINQMIMAYKVFKVVTYKDKIDVLSAFQETCCIKNGLNISSRITLYENNKNNPPNKLSLIEKETQAVYRGFHAFINKKDAIKLQQQLTKRHQSDQNNFQINYACEVFPILIEPKNIVIIGKFDLSNYSPYSSTIREYIKHTLKTIIENTFDIFNSKWFNKNNSIVCTQYYLLNC